MEQEGPKVYYENVHLCSFRYHAGEKKYHDPVVRQTCVQILAAKTTASSLVS